MDCTWCQVLFDNHVFQVKALKVLRSIDVLSQNGVHFKDFWSKEMSIGLYPSYCKNKQTKKKNKSRGIGYIPRSKCEKYSCSLKQYALLPLI